MSEAHAPAAWWEEVEHLRESAERRIAERERAQREGREPAALPPLRPLRDSERAVTPPAASTHAPRPLQPATAPARASRFRRAGTGTTAAHAAAHAATATATALVLEDGPLPTWVPEGPDPLVDPAPLPEAAPRAGAAPSAPARPAPARDEDAERPTRREELSRLAREQARAAAAARPRAAGPVRAGTPVAGRRTVEIRGRVEPRAVIAAVPDPVEPAVDPYRRRRPRRTAAERFAAQPDRVALWAFLLGLFLLLVALISAHG